MTVLLTGFGASVLHSDEYSLTLFYATRIEALSLEQIKRKFPEPEAKKAQAVLDRYISTGLIHKTSEVFEFPSRFVSQLF